MFWVRVAKEKDILDIKNLIEEYDLTPFDESNLDNYMVGDFDGNIISLSAFDVSGNTALLHSLVVKEEFRGKYFGDTQARAMINLAERRFIRYIYKGINDLNQGYFLARMRYCPISKEEFSQTFEKECDYKEVWKLDVVDFFNHSCSCSEK
jgi:N-acetylglutamate synthase-like GNAT family acetyltransferase